MAHGDLEISGDGKAGEDGRDGYGYNGHAPQFGVNGMNGEHAKAATNGGNGQTVHVSLSRSGEEVAGHPTGYLVVTVDKHNHQCVIPQPHSKEKEAFIHDLGAGGSVLLSACGGHGGNGGSGGNGQGGGHGRNGQDANRQMSGTNGEGGGNGGNPGDGTSGANGGKAGDIKLFIKEEDMDLMVAIKTPLVLGGKGGNAGKNGLAGRGGNGGRGGSSFTWRETTRTGDIEHTITRTNAAGLPGAGGQGGSESRAKLENGEDGPDGSVHIFVQNQDGQLVGPFASVYKLEVVGFDILDGNDDGVLEFGEEITLTNIRIRNAGGSPSPRFAQVTVQGESTAWLVAPQTTLTMPVSILNGSTIKLDGTFCFRVKRANSFPVGSPFTIDDSFKLRAHMSRIERTVPGFHKPRTITLQHPIEMSKPRFLRCLTVGQEAVFSWTVENNSKKDLGVESLSGRMIQAMIHEAGNSLLNFGSGSSHTLGTNLSVPINLLTSHRSTSVEIVVKMLPTAIPYMKTKARVALHFTPPDHSEPASIQDYDLPIQVSNTFNYNPESKVILVTNYGTSSDEVESWHSLVCDGLGLKMDIWNVSLNGHLETIGNTRQSLFQLYKGKTVIMLGNQFPYFERGQRTAMDLIDQKDFAPAAFGGTSLFVSGIDLDQDAINHIPRLLRAGTYSLFRTFSTVNHLVKAVLSARNDKGFYDTKFICTPTIKGDVATRCANKADKAANELRRRVPNLRFIISWSAEKGSGQVEVMPCIPYDNAKFILTRPSTRRFEELNGYGVLFSLPFATRLEMLWDVFSGDKRKTTTQSPPGLADIVEYDLVIELARFTHPNPPWPDCISKHEIMSHLKRLDLFFNYNSSRPFSRESVNRVTSILGTLMLLADSCTGSWPLAMTFSTRRKNVWAELNRVIDMFITKHYGHLEGTPAGAQYNQYLAEQTSQMKKENPAGKRDRLVQQVIAKVAVGVGVSVSDTTDVLDIEMIGSIVRNQSETSAWEQLDSLHESQLEEDLAHAKEEVDDMSRLPTYS